MADIRSTTKIHQVITKGTATRVVSIVKNHVVHVTNASAQGADGPEGPEGPAGAGVPAGGTDGQVLTKQSATDFHADWEDPTGGGGVVDSVFGRTGVVVAVAGDYTTDQVTEATNLYYTDARVVAVALSRSASDFTTFPLATPVANDYLLFESFATGAKFYSLNRNLPVSDATVTALAGKADSVHTHVATDITDFDTEVSNNASVAANTAHAALVTGNPHQVAYTELTGDLDYWDFNPLGTPPSRVEGRMWYDADLNAIHLYVAGTEVTQTLGHEIFATVFNDNVSDIPNGAVVVTDPTGPFGAVHLALASDPVRAVGTAGIATELIEVGTQGMATVMGAVRGIDTSLWPINTILYLSDTVPGGLTDTPPESPSYVIIVGLVIAQHATEGVVYVRVSDQGNEQGVDRFFNGTVLESVDTEVVSNGTTVTFTLSNALGGDLSLIFDEGLQVFTAPDSVTLIPGTDTVPALNYVFVLQSTMTLTANTTGFPSTQHLPVATVLCQTAASALADGVYKHHKWNDHLGDASDQGHLSHINSWIRAQHATWLSGGVPTIDIQTVADPDDMYFDLTAGTARQLHINSFPSMDTETGDHILVVNDNTVPYRPVTNLNTMLTTALGVSMSGTRFSLVFIAVVNSDNTVTVLCNLPNGTYGSDLDAITDPNNFAVYDLPEEFRGTGILIARAVIRHQVTGGGTWSEVLLEDLRGNLIGSTSGGGAGGGGGGTEFSDATFRILNASDATKELAFDASAITTGNTRTMTVPDLDGTIALTSQLVATAIEYRDGESVFDTFDTTLPIGMIELVNVSDDGGLDISWGVGKLLTPGVVNTIAGNGTCVDHVVNYLFWSTGTGLTLSTTRPEQTDVTVATINCQDGDIWGVHMDDIIGEIQGDTHYGITRTIPTLVSEGMEVTEDTDVTNALDVSLSAGRWFRHLHDEHIVAALLSRNVPLVRWFRVAGVWTSDTNAEIDTTQWDDGSNLVPTTTNRYYPSCFVVGEGVLHWLYPQYQYFTENEAIGGLIPELPPGLEGLPKVTGYVVEANEATFATAGNRWRDLRTRVAEPVPVNAFSAVATVSDTIAAEGTDTLRFLVNTGLLVTAVEAAGAPTVTHSLDSTASVQFGSMTLTGQMITPALLSFTPMNIQNVMTIAFGSAPQCDAFDEKTADAGITIDGLLIKDSGIPEVAVTTHEAAITHDNLSGAGTNTHAQIDTHLALGPEHNTDEAIEIIIDGGGSTITAGIKGDIVVKADMTITGWTLLADQSGTIQVDIWKDTYANFPPTVADTIVTPSLTAVDKNQATGLSISVTKGDVIRFNVDSSPAPASVQRLTVALIGVLA